MISALRPILALDFSDSFKGFIIASLWDVVCDGVHSFPKSLADDGPLHYCFYTLTLSVLL